MLVFYISEANLPINFCCYAVTVLFRARFNSSLPRDSFFETRLNHLFQCFMSALTLWHLSSKPEEVRRFAKTPGDVTFQIWGRQPLRNSFCVAYTCVCFNNKNWRFLSFLSRKTTLVHPKQPQWIECKVLTSYKGKLLNETTYLTS